MIRKEPSAWLTGSNLKKLYVYTTNNAAVTIDQSFDVSATSSSRLYFYANGNLTIDTTGGNIDLKSDTIV